MRKNAAKAITIFTTTIALAAFVSPSFAVKEFEKDFIEIAKELANAKIPRPVVRSFDQSIDMTQNIHFRIFDVTKEICQQEKISKKDCRWNIRVDRTPDFNAYATKSNQIVISSGLVDSITFEDELAFVIAHEVAHHLLRHVDKKSKTIFVGSILGSILLDDYIAGLFLGQVVNAVSSREYEAKADAIALKIIKNADFDLQKARYLLMRLAKMEYRITSKFMQSHPSGFERIVAFDEISKRL